jgi:hypothetical protein
MDNKQTFLTIKKQIEDSMKVIKEFDPTSMIPFLNNLKTHPNFEVYVNGYNSLADNYNNLVDIHNNTLLENRDDIGQIININKCILQKIDHYHISHE